MTEVYLGQIMMTGFGFAPKTFALCNGQLMSISQNQALFSLLGTYYGGNGTTNFSLPNLQGRTPISYGNSVDQRWQPTYAMAEVGGAEAVTLNSQQIPAHFHQANGTTSNGDQRAPTGALFGKTALAIYAQTGGPQVPLSPQSVAPNAGGQPHDNLQPFNAINFCIALSGVYPSRS
ncbi:phage tail protein [Ensifer sp. 2YAB10]|uniref:phage tail protein n=1 Tax=unclassified Ensifer TaxID=2633371 RepID=UPI003F92CE1F